MNLLNRTILRICEACGVLFVSPEVQRILLDSPRPCSHSWEAVSFFVVGGGKAHLEFCHECGELRFLCLVGVKEKPIPEPSLLRRVDDLQISDFFFPKGGEVR